MNAKMSFGIMNVVATFQREMDIDFFEEKFKFFVVHMDAITLFLKLIGIILSIWKKFILSEKYLVFP